MWKQILIAASITTLICGGRANPIDGDSRIYKNKILEMLNDLRLRMCYTEPGGLPQLEPLQIKDRLDLSLQDGPTRINGFIEDLKVEGLSQFIVDYLSFTITLKINVTLALPKLVITGKYGLDANIGGFFKVAGIGPFRLELTGIQFKAGAAFVYNEKMMLRGLSLEPKLKTLNADIENLTADKYVTQFFNDVISASMPEVVNEHIPPGTIESVQDYLEELASSHLAELKISDLLDIITGKTSPLPPLDLEKACKI